MLKHIIFWKLNQPQNAAEIANDLDKRFKNLVGKVEGLLEAEVGCNTNGGDFDIALYTVFDSVESEQKYQTNPLHVEIKQIVHTLVCARQCIDYVV